MTETSHTPVLLEEAMEYLDVMREGVYIDCTLGLAGHTKEILSRNPHASVIGMDLDEKSILIARERLKSESSRVKLYHSDFRYLPDLKLDFRPVRGILIDLGISSYQLDLPERGFSYSQDGPLDMRMDLRNKFTAEKIINKYNEHKLAEILHQYGELRQAKRIARVIAARRKINKIESTVALRRIIEEVCRWRPQKGKIHPAAKVFQALRIEVNQELRELDEFIERITHLIPLGTRIVVISFHSLEDRIIKHAFQNLGSGDEYPPHLKILTKKPVMASESELERNSRSRSAKLRAAEKIHS